MRCRAEGSLRVAGLSVHALEVVGDGAVAGAGGEVEAEPVAAGVSTDVGEFALPGGQAVVGGAVGVAVVEGDVELSEYLAAWGRVLDAPLRERGLVVCPVVERSAALAKIAA